MLPYCSHHCHWHHHHYSMCQVGEGKNESDSLGSLVKLAYCRALHQHRDMAARSVEEVAALIRENLAESTEKLDFIEIHVVDAFSRDKKPKGIPVKGIQQIHHFTKKTDGSIITRELSCLKCILQKSCCEQCQKISPVHEQTAVTDYDKELEDVEDDIEEDENDTSVCEEDEDKVVDEEEDEDDSLAPGTVVWARLRSWYPATICSPEDIPDSLKKLLPDHPATDVFVKRFEPFSDVRVIKAKNIDQLSENRCDKARAAKSEAINKAYSLALATMRGDI